MNNSLNSTELNEYNPELDYSWEFDQDMAENAFAPGMRRWNGQNRDISTAYRRSHDFLKVIYSLADSFLEKKLGKDYSLPIDVRTLAEKCNFVVQSKDFSELIEERRDCTFSPVAQFQMRSLQTEDEVGKIAGTINVADYLGETSVRFSIAHELAHFVLRKHNPIGLNYLHEACPGMYPLSDSDELLSDLFAYAVMLPYRCFCEVKEEYEHDKSRWPVDFSDWIVYLRDKTQMPEYHVVLAYQSIKQYTIARRVTAAKENPVTWLNNIIAYLTEANFSKSEIKELLLYQEATGKVKEIQDRLAETIDIIQDQMRELDVKREEFQKMKAGQPTDQLGISPELMDEQCFSYSYKDVIQEDLQSESKDETSYWDWKKSIMNKLFYLGMATEELHDIAEKAGVPSEYVNRMINEMF